MRDRRQAAGLVQADAGARERFRALALDYRDVGDSDGESEQYSIRDLAEDVRALAGELGIEHASLVGISMGGFIALELRSLTARSSTG